MRRLLARPVVETLHRWAVGLVGLSHELAASAWLAAFFGKKRWVRGEGVHGILKSFYKLNAKRIRYRSGVAVDLELNIVFSIITSLAMQQREHLAAQASAAPPPAPAPSSPALIAV